MSGAVEIRTGSLADIHAAHLRVPELHPPTGVSAYEERIGDRAFIALIAIANSQPVGFKLGFARDDNEFYSWIGGVDPAYRGRGIAQDLITRQEELAVGAGYSVIRVKSMNRYPGMLRLLLANGYQIDGYDANSGPDDAKILFAKGLA